MESNYYNEQFTKYLKEQNKIKEAEHEASGKISPSKLCKPTLEAVLQLLGVPPDPPSDQSLRYFLRGSTFEEVAIKAVTLGRTTYKLQASASYRNGQGYIDVLDKVPHEIKSAGAWTFRTVQKQATPLLHHALQASWYALAKNCDTAWIHYLNTDTLQLLSFKVTAQDHKHEVDRRHDLIVSSLLAGTCPDFEPLDPFHKSIKYSDYSLFFGKKGDEAETILNQYYPTQYKLLKSKALAKDLA